MIYRVFIIEPEPLTRQGLVLTLQAQPDLNVCGSACCAGGALDALEACAPDLVITALDLADQNGLDLTQALIQRYPRLRILVLSRHAEPMCAERALRAGARGYVVKQEPPEVVLEAARLVLAGSYYVSQNSLDGLLQAISRSSQTLIPSPSDVLSERELELFDLIGSGISTHEIAAQMSLSVKTVESYRNRIKHKLNVETMAELVRRAVIWKSPERYCFCWVPKAVPEAAEPEATECEV